MATSFDKPPISPLLQEMLRHEFGGQQQLSKSESGPKRQNGVQLMFADPNNTPDIKLSDGEKARYGESPLVKGILSVLNGGAGDGNIERLAFETDPGQTNAFSSLYKAKLRLIPDAILKRIAIQDDLVASIVNARGNQISAFGRPPEDRFSLGFVIEPKTGILDDLEDDAKERLQNKIDAVTKRLMTCGRTEGWADQEKMSFSQYLYMQTRHALILGRIATEVVYARKPGGERAFHSFRPIDAGTIYRAAPYQQPAEQVRETAMKMLEQLKQKRISKDKWEEGKNVKYAWIQVVEGRPVQALTAEECVVHNFYPVNDVELDGYPLTPLDTVIAAVTTHINITTHAKLYFQAGRATRGMLVIKSDDVDETVVSRIRQQFNASINSVNNAWRMPVFGVAADDDLVWSPIDATGSRDMEFQYLSDTNARVILSAFQMSPEELPGYAHLSRGTNNQALSESNQEYKLEAHRDVGIRPLIAQFEDFLNACILPLFDEEVAEHCKLRLKGLDADTAEKESTRLSQDMPLHMTMDEVLQKVEKKPLGPEACGEIPLNPQWLQLADAHMTVGEFEERFMGRKGASKDPSLQYRRDPMWFNFMQMQMAAQQPQGGQGGGGDAGGGGGQPPAGGDAGSGGGGKQDGSGGGAQGSPQVSPTGDQSAQQPNEGQDTDLTRGITQALELLTKNESALPPGKRRLLVQQRKTCEHILDSFEKESQDLVDKWLTDLG